jgi:Family of unknown function (DUF5670)
MAGIYFHLDPLSMVAARQCLAYASEQTARPLIPYAGRRLNNIQADTTMLETIAILLLILWLLGMVSAHTFGGFIHILLVIAVVVVLVRIIRGRNPL